MKYLIVIAVCGLLLLSLNIADAQNHVGIILSGQDTDCTVIHQGVSYPCQDRKRLYVGDEVHKKPSVKQLKIKWAPYFNGEIKTNTTMAVVAVPAETMKGNISSSGIKQYINDFVKPVSYGAVPLVTRGGKKAALTLYRIIPVRASLLTDYPLHLSAAGADDNVKSISVMDSKGEKVFEETIVKRRPAILTPERLNLKPMQPYTIDVVKYGSIQKMTVTSLDQATREEVMKGLAGIDRENSSPSETLIGKVAYLQLISDAYPEKVDLYWLGHQLLLEYPQRYTKDEEEIVRQLVQRYYQHNKSLL
ncbi:MAG: hypothetical protein CSYNP_01158 [Syntrophus sp. SKADARSKE-3]|nr:hypothetical protein [Syntrophus sp. SKADARSKE-3]